MPWVEAGILEASRLFDKQRRHGGLHGLIVIHEEGVWFKVIIRENQRGYLLKDGKFIRLLETGKHSYYPLLGQIIETVPVNGAVNTCGIDVSILCQDPMFEKSTVRIQVLDNTIALHYIDGRLVGALKAGDYLFWNIFTKNTFETIDISDHDTANNFPPNIFNAIPVTFYTKIEVPDGEIALLYFGGKFQRRLDSGTRYFWNNGQKITHQLVDTRLQPLDISGQEILTADKISLRLNFTCNYKITDPIKAIGEIKDLKTQPYSFVQLIIREFVGRYRFDELLKQKDRIFDSILEKLRVREQEFFVSFSDAGLRDIILPGEIRDIMNSVLVAEKTAQASVITRREEIASTRSLMETAKLMEENEILYRLKEMEYIERICEKVGNISIDGNNVLESLRRLVSSKTEK